MDSDKRKLHPLTQYLIYAAAFMVSAVFLLATLFSLTGTQADNLKEGSGQERTVAASGTLKLGRIANPWYAELFFGVQGWRQEGNSR